MGGVGVSTFRWDDESFVARTKARSQDDRTVAANGRFDEILRETLRLCLGANENGHAENHAKKTEQQRSFAVYRKAQAEVKRRRHQVTVPLKRPLFFVALACPAVTDLDLPSQRNRRLQLRSRLLCRRPPRPAMVLFPPEISPGISQPATLTDRLVTPQ